MRASLIVVVLNLVDVLHREGVVPSLGLHASKLSESHLIASGRRDISTFFAVCVLVCLLRTRSTGAVLIRTAIEYLGAVVREGLARATCAFQGL